MPDENRFAGIGDAVEEAEPPSGTGASDEEGDASAGDPDAPGDEDATREAESPDETPAFPFEDTVQKSVYVRPETFEELEDAEALVDAQLRTDHAIRDLTRREFFDAVFREAAEDTDALVERVRRMREE